MHSKHGVREKEPHKLLFPDQLSPPGHFAPGQTVVGMRLSTDGLHGEAELTRRTVKAVNVS